MTWNQHWENFHQIKKLSVFIIYKKRARILKRTYRSIQRMLNWSKKFIQSWNFANAVSNSFRSLCLAINCILMRSFLKVLILFLHTLPIANHGPTVVQKWHLSPKINYGWQSTTGNGSLGKLVHRIHILSRENRNNACA